MREPIRTRPPPSEHGTHKTVKPIFWPWRAGKSPHHLSTCSLLGLGGTGDYGIVRKAHRRLYHSTLGSRAIKKKKGGTGDFEALLRNDAEHQLDPWIPECAFRVSSDNQDLTYRHPKTVLE